MTYDISGKRVWVTGHRGMVGSAVARRLSRESCDVLTAEHAMLDLRRQAEVGAWMAERRPNVVVIAAARVGGIHAPLQSAREVERRHRTGFRELVREMVAGDRALLVDALAEVFHAEI